MGDVVNGADWRDLRELAASLAPGQSVGHRVCPKCGQAGSFSVFSNDAGYGWKCHRAACGGARFYPRAPLAAGRVRPDAGPAPRTPRPYPFPLVFPDPAAPVWDRLAVPPQDRAPALAASLGLHAREGFDNETVWRLRDFDFRTRGHLSRVYPSKDIRTWRLAGTGALYATFQNSPVTDLWLVEDCVSAARLAMEGGGANALALLGTHVSAELEEDLYTFVMRTHTLRRLSPPTIVVALDPDATDKAYAISRRLTAILPARILCAPLKADIKDFPVGEIKTLVSYYSPGV